MSAELSYPMAECHLETPAPPRPKPGPGDLDCILALARRSERGALLAEDVAAHVQRAQVDLRNALTPQVRMHLALIESITAELVDTLRGVR